MPTKRVYICDECGKRHDEYPLFIDFAMIAYHGDDIDTDAWHEGLWFCDVACLASWVAARVTEIVRADRE